MDISLEDLKPLKKVYKKALVDKAETFKYKNETLVTAYAKYLIEH